MRCDRRAFIAASLAAELAAGHAWAQSRDPLLASPAPPGEIVPLWPLGAPGAPATPPTETVTERSPDPAHPDRAVYGIAHPRLAVFRPAQPNGAAVLITPGGGFRWVVIDKEGYEIAQWLTAHGYTAFVLFYRLPGEGWAAGPDVALADAQRAMRLIRARAAAYGLDPARVAAMGFSAGGHVCADLAARFAVPTYMPVDAADALSARPVCAAPIYPVVSMDPAIAHPGSRQLLLGPAPTPALEAAHSPDRATTPDSPPHFVLHAEDDPAVPIDNTLRLRAALKARHIRVETHLFERGGHGFGLRQAAGLPVAAWPELWHAWAHTTDLL